MKQYKAFIIGFILAVIPINSAYGILGVGVQGGQGLFTVGAKSLEDPSGFASMATAEFSNSLITFCSIHDVMSISTIKGKKDVITLIT